MSVLLKSVRMPPGAILTPPVIQVLTVQKGINRTQITCSLLTTCSVCLHFVNMEKCHFTLCRNLYDYKLQNVAPLAAIL